MKNIFNLDAVMKTADALYDNGFDIEGVTVIVPVTDRELLQKANEDFHYRLHPDGELQKDVDTVDLKVGKVFFRYVYTEPKEENGDAGQ